MSRTGTSEQDAALRQAVAVALVRSKRKYAQETAELRSKAQKYEAELQEQQIKRTQLQQWLTATLQQHGCDGSCQQQDQQGTEQSPTIHPLNPGIFLPPLAATEHDSSSPPHLLDSYQALQRQLALAAAAAGDTYGAVADVLEGKATMLTDMLLTNVGMLQRLWQVPVPRTSPAGITADASSLFQGRTSESVASISSFITKTLLCAPKSSLSTAYMRQCAAVLAAVLARPQNSTALSPAANSRSEPAKEQHEADTSESLAVQVVQMMQVLLEESGIATGQALTAPTSGSSSSSAATVQAASAMLQQLSTLPGTALLLCLAVAQRLQQSIEQLQEANRVVMRVNLADFSSHAAQGEQALLIASQLFQASHELLLSLEGAVLQIPIWGVALASSSWTPRALEDLVASATVLYRACPELQAQQPLLAARICSFCANLASALQQLAANGDAPGMRVGLGAELRSATGSLCVRLRDTFMPMC